MTPATSAREPERLASGGVLVLSSRQFRVSELGKAVNAGKVREYRAHKASRNVLTRRRVCYRFVVDFMGVCMVFFASVGMANRAFTRVHS